MLPKEVTKPLADIGKKNPAVALLLTLLIIVVIVLYTADSKKDSAESKRCATSEAKAWAAWAQERKEKDSIIKDANRELREQIKENKGRIPSQDSAIKTIIKLKK
jgi:hypothetical protein